MDPDAFDRRLSRHCAAPVAVAVSGGSDSTALLWLAAGWARQAGRPLLALTVDHRLHPDSGRWTAEAGVLAARLGVAWLALAWTGDKPTTGLPAAARRARHALLANAAREAGAAVIMMGHTADDVAESELIRIDTPTHGRLAEWSPSPVWPEGRGVFLLRPLLDHRRAELRTLLAAQGLGWLDDPANADLRFARIRARMALDGAAPNPPQTVPRGVCGSGRADATGCIRIARDASCELIAKAVLCASGRERLPRGPAIARLQARFSTGEDFAATLSGAKVLAQGREVLLVRDPGERRSEVALSRPEFVPPRGGKGRDGGGGAATAEKNLRDASPSLSDLSCKHPHPCPSPLEGEGSSLPLEETVFDGRFLVSTAPLWRVTSLSGLAARLPDTDVCRLRQVPAEGRRALPVLISPDGEVRLPAPFGDGPGVACALAPQRFAAACGRIQIEAEIGHDFTTPFGAYRSWRQGTAHPMLAKKTKAYACAAAREARSERT